MNKQKEIKEFIDWTKLKVKTHFKNQKLYFHEREIWWASLGKNIGYEQDGKHENFERPVLIIKKFNGEVLWVLPMSTKNKDNKYYFKTNYKNKTYSIITSQLKLISSKRLLRKIRTLPEEDYNELKNKMSFLIKQNETR